MLASVLYSVNVCGCSSRSFCRNNLSPQNHVPPPHLPDSSWPPSFVPKAPCPRAALEALLRGPYEDDQVHAGQREVVQTSGSAPMSVCPCEVHLF